MNGRLFPVALIVLAISIAAAMPSTCRAAPEDIAARIQQLKAGDGRGWTQIPWTASLLDARKASEKEQVPVFLFTLDGNIGTGRC